MGAVDETTKKKNADLEASSEGKGEGEGEPTEPLLNSSVKIKVFLPSSSSSTASRQTIASSGGNNNATTMPQHLLLKKQQDEYQQMLISARPTTKQYPTTMNTIQPIETQTNLLFLDQQQHSSQHHRKPPIQHELDCQSRKGLLQNAAVRPATSQTGTTNLELQGTKVATAKQKDYQYLHKGTTNSIEDDMGCSS